MVADAAVAEAEAALEAGSGDRRYGVRNVSSCGSARPVSTAEDDDADFDGDSARELPADLKSSCHLEAASIQGIRTRHKMGTH